MNIELKKIGKKYENRIEYTLEDINIDIKSKEFVVILGPSGCGKTTLLRMIAGLISITKGDLLFDGKRVNELSPAARGVAMVFQSYALYPQMDVYKNISYGLRIRNVRKDIIDRRVRDVAKLLKIEDNLYDKPKDLSGGQRQRVAIGRAIARKPDIFLMDEPLSNLDAKLREKMRKELIEIHRMVGATTIYVTHDQLEAMSMADKIILLNDNVIQQIDSPLNLYMKPKNLFVAGFIGSPTMNLVKGNLKGNKFISVDSSFEIALPKDIPDKKDVTLGIRSENIKISPSKGKNLIKGKAYIRELLGKEQLIYFNVSRDVKIIVSEDSSKKVSEDSSYNLKIDTEKIHLFDNGTGNRIEY